MKKIKILLLVIVLMVCAVSVAGLQIFKDKTTNEVEAYLIEERGYNPKDIYAIYTQIGKAPLVSTTVIFEDDRSSRYFYRKENGRIYQYSRAPVHGVDDGTKRYKHMEE
ncbi:hypothetical protein C162_07454 [Paenibacillus sp. FSL R7-269]|uniref:hypothetical protein n=1 Tax=Paenibacillus sp. FSL R7-269 TaxID=1226755 RepID=UPI0003E1F18A|nr:hypothetical protein [Paenibacillus sp. FSL R7-269]ETT53072.1 hypothetical protein C162_07454 [Paenibacillus sp. FSL R7-269]